MKKILLIAVIAVFSSTAIAQEDVVENDSKVKVKVALDFGSSTNDKSANNLEKLNVGFNFAYLYGVTDDLEIGATTGLRRIFKDKSNDDNSIIEEESGGVINFGVEARLYSDNDKFYIGGDTGYAVGLYDDGFYFRPKLGFVISENSGFFASYTEINADIKYTTVNIGYEYSF